MSVVEENVDDIDNDLIESSDDDFGNFSDASFEDDTNNHKTVKTEKNNNKDTNNIYALIDECFPVVAIDMMDESKNNKPCFQKENLNHLLSDERCNIIYQQLTNNQIMSEPIIWSRSHIRSTMLQILGVEESKKLKNGSDNNYNKKDILDDSLFVKICQLIDSNASSSNSCNITNNNNNNNTEKEINQLNNSDINNDTVPMTLRDHFKIKYNPIVMQQPKALIDQKTTDDILNEIVPTLLNFSLNDTENDDGKVENSSGNIDNIIDEKLIEYHDNLCNMIDKLVLQLKLIKQEQIELIKDKITFENVVTNLSGHTQRLQRDEIALYNKKMKKKRKNKLVVAHSRINTRKSEDRSGSNDSSGNDSSRKTSSTAKSSNQWKRFSWVGL